MTKKTFTKEEQKEKAKAARLKWEKAHPENAKARTKKWREANPEKARAACVAWRETHLEYDKARHKKWGKENPEKVRTANAAWRKANPDKAKASCVAWRKINAKRIKDTKSAWDKANPEAHKRHKHNRKARISTSGGKLSPGLETKLLAFQKNRCAICRVALKKTGHHLDHIAPLSRGGKNLDGNMQITCPKCNHEKYAKDPIAFMQSRGYLL